MNYPRNNHIEQYGGWQFLMWIVLLAALYGRLFESMHTSPDFPQYVAITEELVHLGLMDLFPFETLSRGLLWLSALILGDPLDGVIALHWVLTLGFVYGFVLLTRLRRNNWHGALMVMAAYGVLLCFVTVRATPAYLIATYAVMQHRYRPRMAFFLLILASEFHVSALMALPAMLINQVSWNYTTLVRERISMALFLAGLGSYVAVLMGFNYADVFGVFFGGYEDLAKFMVYAEDPMAASFAHRFYFILVTILTLLFVLGKSKLVTDQKMYVCISYLIYSLASFSPVVAYRQSIYFVIPLLLIYPWRQIFSSEIRVMFFIFGCLVVYCFNFISIFHWQQV
jgi:hypothetical protein